MNNEEDVKIDKLEYPIHYHGYIQMFDPNNQKVIADTDKELVKMYGETADELGIG